MIFSSYKLKKARGPGIPRFESLHGNAVSYSSLLKEHTQYKSKPLGKRYCDFEIKVANVSNNSAVLKLSWAPRSEAGLYSPKSENYQNMYP